MEALIEHSALYALFYMLLLYGIGYHAVLIHNICHKYVTTRFCHPFCLIQCSKLFLRRLQMIHRSEYECEVKFIVSKLFKLCGIALVCLYFIALLLQSAEVMLN